MTGSVILSKWMVFKSIWNLIWFTNAAYSINETQTTMMKKAKTQVWLVYTPATNPNPLSISRNREYIMGCKQLKTTRGPKNPSTTQCLCVADCKMKMKSRAYTSPVGNNVVCLYTKHSSADYSEWCICLEGTSNGRFLIATELPFISAVQVPL